MANGRRFNYESPLDRLLNYTIPTMIGEERTRQDREVYRDELKQEREADNIENKRRWDITNQQNIQQYKARINEEEDDELYKRGLDKLEIVLREQDMVRQKAQLEAMEATSLHPSILNLVTSNLSGLETKIGEIDESMKEFSEDKYYDFSPRQLSRIKNQLTMGSPEGAHQVADKMYKDKFTNPYTANRASIIVNQLKDISTAEGALTGITTDEANTERERLGKEKTRLDNALADLYDQDRPFNPVTERSNFQTSLFDDFKAAGLDIDKIGRDRLGEKYRPEVKAYLDEYILGETAKYYTSKEREDASKKVREEILKREKDDPIPLPEKGKGLVGKGIDYLGPTGLALLGYGAVGQKENVKKAYNFLSDKAVESSKNIMKTVKMPAGDVIKFVESAHSEQVGSIGKSMPKIQRFIDKVEASADKPTSKRYKSAVKALNEQVNKLADNLYKRGVVSESLKREDLIKLLKNPGKYRFAKTIAQMKRKYPGLKRGVTKWGIFSASMKIGEALGDPTAGIATGLAVTKGVPTTGKKIKSSIVSVYKKNPKAFRAKVMKRFKPVAAKRIMQWVANPATKNPWVGGTMAIGGAAMTAYDLYQIIISPEEE